MQPRQFRITALAAMGAALLLLAGCGGGGDGTQPSPAAGSVGSSITLAWNPPTANTDETVLNNLAGYHIYFGTNPNRLNRVITLTTPGLSSYVVDNLSPATYYFAMTAYTSDGTESDFSVIARWTIS